MATFIYPSPSLEEFEPGPERAAMRTNTSSLIIIYIQESSRPGNTVARGVMVKYPDGRKFRGAFLEISDMGDRLLAGDNDHRRRRVRAADTRVGERRGRATRRIRCAKGGAA